MTRAAVDAPADDGLVDDDLWRRVAALPERQRTAVALRYVVDLDHAAVARALGTTPAATRRLVSDALATLRRRPVPQRPEHQRPEPQE